MTQCLGHENVCSFQRCIHGDGVVALLEVDDGEVATWKDLLGGFQRHKGVPSAMVAMSLDHNDYC